MRVAFPYSLQFQQILSRIMPRGTEQTMPKTLNEPKRAPLNIRTTQERRERLEALAAQNGLSLTAQVERRH